MINLLHTEIFSGSIDVNKWYRMHSILSSFEIEMIYRMHDISSSFDREMISSNSSSNFFHTFLIIPQHRSVLVCYASAFRLWRHYVFGLSVRPSVRLSVRSLKYPLLTCTWVRWSTRPTVTILRHVRPSVCPSVRLSARPSGEVSGHLPENAWRD